MSGQSGFRKNLFLNCSIGLATAWAFVAAPAAAQEAAEAPEESAVGEIVVTAQFREQNLQDVPLSITAIPGETLEERSLSNTTQIAAPSVTLRRGNAAFGGGTMQAFIRGFGQGDHSFASEPGVAVYVDDVYHATLFGSVFDLLDLERLEVLRGPQGTLFGKNAIGGAIRLVGRKADGGGDGSAEITIGSNNRLDVRAAWDGTIVEDHLFVRVAGSSKSNDGYQDVFDFACRNPGLAGSIPTMVPSGGDCLIGHYGGEDVQAARVNLRWVPTDTVEVSIIADGLNDNSPAPANYNLALDTQADAIANWNTNINIPRYGVPLDERFLTGNPFETYATYADPFTGEVFPRTIAVNEWGVSGALDWELSDNLALKYIAAYRAYTGGFAHDSDGSPLAFQMIYNDLEHQQTTHEVRLTGNFADRLNYTIGAFHYNGEEEEHNTVHIYGFDVTGLCARAPTDPPCTPVRQGGTIDGLYIPLVFESNDTYENTNKSAFVHLEFAVTDRLNILGGYRYTDEEKDLAINRFFQGDPPPTATTRSDWRLGADYHVTDDFMIFANAATGYRSGGFNPRPFIAADLVSYGPEEDTTYELGFKSDWLDQRLRLNVTAFYSDFTNLVVNVLRTNLNGDPSTVPTNAASAQDKGVEIEFEAQPVDNFVISATYAMNSFNRDRTDAANPPLDERNNEDQPGPFPRQQFTFGAQYELGLGDYGALTPRLDWYWQSETNFSTAVVPEPIATQEAYGTGNFRLTWDAPSDDWSVSFAVTNFTDEDYYINIFSLQAAGFGTVEAQPGTPRQWLASVKRRF